MFSSCSNRRMAYKRLDSVNDCSRYGFNLLFTCKHCGQAVEANAVALGLELRRAVADLPLRLLERRARCRACGKRGARIAPCEKKF